MSYPITDIDGVDGEVAAVLKSVGIRSTDRLLEAARTVKGRKVLATKTGFNEKQLLYWANVADRMRIKACARSMLNCCRRQASIRSRNSSIETRSISPRRWPTRTGSAG